MDKIRIGRRRGWTTVLRQGFEDFSRSSRSPPSSESEDAALLGYDGLRTIMELRLQHSLSLHIPVPVPVPVPIIDIPPIVGEATPRRNSATESRVRFSPVETFFDANRSTIISDSTTRIDESSLPSSTVTHRSLFIPGFLQVPRPLSALYQVNEEHRSKRRGTSRTNMSLAPKIVEIEDSSEDSALSKPPSDYEINDSTTSLMIPSPNPSPTTPYIGQQLVESSRVVPLPKGPVVEVSNIMVPPVSREFSFDVEAEGSVRIVEHLVTPSLPLSDLDVEVNEVAGGSLEASSAAEMTPLVEQHAQYTRPSPSLSLPLGESIHMVTPPWSAQPDLSPAAVPARVELVTPVDLAHNPFYEYGTTPRFSVDAGKNMARLPQSTPKISHFQTPLDSPSLNSPEPVGVVLLARPTSSNSGGAAVQANPDSSFPMVLAQHPSNIAQDYIDAIVIAPQPSSTAITVHECKQTPVDNVPVPLSPSKDISMVLGETLRSEKMSDIAARSDVSNSIAAFSGTLASVAAKIPLSPRLEHLVPPHERQRPSARQTTYEESISGDVSNEINLAETSAPGTREGGSKIVAHESQQVDEGSEVEDSKVVHRSRKDQDDHDLSKSEMSSAQRKKHRRREREKAERKR